MANDPKLALKPPTEKKTYIRRATVLQEARVVLEPCAYARKVQLWSPNSPQVLVLLDTLPDEVGQDRVYKMTPLPPAGFPSFRLEPGQWILAACEQGQALLTVVEEVDHG